jgi:hypothetical protein
MGMTFNAPLCLPRRSQDQFFATDKSLDKLMHVWQPTDAAMARAFCTTLAYFRRSMARKNGESPY